MSNWYKSFMKAMTDDITQTDKERGLLYKFRGCTIDDLDKLMKSQNVTRLPEMYRQFMLHMGTGFTPRRYDIMWTVDDLLEDNGSNFFQKGIFIFNYYPSAFAAYGFDTKNESDNPKLLYWDEGFEYNLEMEMEQRNETLSEFLVDIFSNNLY